MRVHAALHLTAWFTREDQSPKTLGAAYTLTLIYIAKVETKTVQRVERNHSKKYFSATKDSVYLAASAVLAPPVTVRAQVPGFSGQRWRSLGAGTSTCQVR